LDREGDRLGINCFIYRSRLRVRSEHQFKKSTIKMRGKPLRALVQSPAEYWRCVIEQTPHSCVLRTLSCEQESDPWSLCASAASAHRWMGNGVDVRFKSTPNITCFLADDRNAMIEMRPSGVAGEADIGRSHFVGEPGFVFTSNIEQRILVPCRQREQVQRAIQYVA